jgi:hypothetical protein
VLPERLDVGSALRTAEVECWWKLGNDNANIFCRKVLVQDQLCDADKAENETCLLRPDAQHLRESSGRTLCDT